MKTLSVLGEALTLASNCHAGITYIQSGDAETRVSYAELKQRALAILGVLQQRGMKPGDQLVLQLKDNEKFIDVFWACILGGISPVPVAVGINDEHRAKLLRIINKLERPYLITDVDQRQRLVTYAEQQDRQAELEILSARTVLVADCEQTGADGKVHQASPQDTAFIQFSSGSTSDPKGVVLTHANLLANIQGIIEAGQFNAGDISLSWMPLTHDMGLIGFHLNMLVCQMEQMLMPTELFSRRPLLWLQLASAKQATILCSPNFGYKHYLKALGDKSLGDVDLSPVRLIYNGAEPISISLCEDFLQRLAPAGLRAESMYTVYGLAEASLAVSFPSPGVRYKTLYVDRHQLGLAQAVRILDVAHADAVGFAIEGKAVPGCEIRIADENNQVLPADTVGAIHICGANVTGGYYRDEKSNATALTDDGWLDTGDLGFLHQQELVVTGRRKDIIFAHGQNYYPHDLETIALRESQLELGKLVVFGVRQVDAEEDELLVFILFRQSLEDFLPLARQVSHVINEQTGLEVNHVIPVKRIPKTTSGKVQRHLLADAYLQGEYKEEITQLQVLHDQLQQQVDGDLSGMQAELKAIVDKVVSDKNLGIHENFFDAGISSLALAEIHQRIDDKWPGQVDVVDLFDYQTIADVAVFLENKLGAL